MLLSNMHVHNFVNSFSWVSVSLKPIYQTQCKNLWPVAERSPGLQFTPIEWVKRGSRTGDDLCPTFTKLQGFVKVKGDSVWQAVFGKRQNEKQSVISPPSKRCLAMVEGSWKCLGRGRDFWGPWGSAAVITGCPSFVFTSRPHLLGLSGWVRMALRHSLLTHFPLVCDFWDKAWKKNLLNEM